MKRISNWLKQRPTYGGVPNWAWCATWSIMLAAVIINLLGIIALQSK